MFWWEFNIWNILWILKNIANYLQIIKKDWKSFQIQDSLLRKIEKVVMWFPIELNENEMLYELSILNWWMDFHDFGSKYFSIEFTEQYTWLISKSNIKNCDDRMFHVNVK